MFLMEFGFVAVVSMPLTYNYKEDVDFLHVLLG